MAAPKNDEGIAKTIDEESIRLTFELGELSMPAGALATLDAGFVFPLRASLARPVTIKANGSAFGVGELVEVDGAIAVRLLEAGDGH